VQDHRSLLCAGQLFYQMSCFWRREAYQRVAGFDRSLRFCFDYDLFLRLTKLAAPQVVHRILSTYRMHDDAKSSTIWQSVGIVERDALREKNGIDSIPEPERAAISRQAWADLRRTNFRHFWCDAVADPRYFFRASGAFVRDRLLGRR